MMISSVTKKIKNNSVSMIESSIDEIGEKCTLPMDMDNST